MEITETHTVLLCLTKYGTFLGSGSSMYSRVKTTRPRLAMASVVYTTSRGLHGFLPYCQGRRLGTRSGYEIHAEQSALTWGGGTRVGQQDAGQAGAPCLQTPLVQS